MADVRLVFRVHAIQRMFLRSISAEDVRDVLETGEIILKYPEDQPYSSRLLLGWSGSQPIHLVVADNVDEQVIIVITVYRPDPGQWDTDFRRKRA